MTCPKPTRSSWRSARLEKHYRDMQDVEFTIEHGKLWMLQTRSGKRTAKAEVKIAVDMANEGLITAKKAVLRVTPAQVDTLLHPQFDAKAKTDGQAKGSCLPGRECLPGAAVGRIYFDADTAEKNGERRRPGCDHGPPLHQAG
jgi:pyruvate, orthophosphate dikinase